MWSLKKKKKTFTLSLDNFLISTPSPKHCNDNVTHLQMLSIWDDPRFDPTVENARGVGVGGAHKGAM